MSPEDAWGALGVGQNPRPAGLDGALPLSGVPQPCCPGQKTCFWPTIKRPITFQVPYWDEGGQSSPGSWTYNLGMNAPCSERWRAAQPGMEPFLQEVDTRVGAIFMTGNKRGCMKALQGPTTDQYGNAVPQEATWLGRVNAYLRQHGLLAELHLSIERDYDHVEYHQRRPDRDGGLSLRIFIDASQPGRTSGVPNALHMGGQQGSQGLPPGWREARDPQSGRVYYQNDMTKETRWDRPG